MTIKQKLSRDLEAAHAQLKIHYNRVDELTKEIDHLFQLRELHDREIEELKIITNDLYYKLNI